MPNWKTLEAREKLLAATVASLDIKALNYRRIATFYGEGTTYDSIEGQFRTIRKIAQQLKGAVENGSHPQAPERGTGPSSRRTTANGSSGSFSAHPTPRSGVKKERSGASNSSTRNQAHQRDAVLGGRVTKAKSSTPTKPTTYVKGLKQEVESSAESVAPSPADSYDLTEPFDLGDGLLSFGERSGISFGGSGGGSFDAGFDGTFEDWVA